MPVTVFSAKVIGTVSIGLWAGYNLSFVRHDLAYTGVFARIRRLREQLLSAHASRDAPAEASATEATEESVDDDAAEPFNAVSTLAALGRSLHASLFAGLVCASNLTAYALSTRASKHPYLLYLALGAPLVGALQFFGAKELWAQIKATPVSSEEPSELSESTYEHISHPAEKETSVADTRASGVSLKSKYSIYTAAVAGLSTFLYTISVIGLAGDTTVRF